LTVHLERSPEETTVTTACQTTRPCQSPRSATRIWIYPGKIDLALVVNWRQAPMEAMVHDLAIAREVEHVRDLTLIARLRLLSAECSMALALCRAEQDTAPGQRDGMLTAASIPAL
jgi:hypothetical protein